MKTNSRKAKNFFVASIVCIVLAILSFIAGFVLPVIKIDLRPKKLSDISAANLTKTTFVKGEISCVLAEYTYASNQSGERINAYVAFVNNNLMIVFTQDRDTAERLDAILAATCDFYAQKTRSIQAEPLKVKGTFLEMGMSASQVENDFNSVMTSIGRKDCGKMIAYALNLDENPEAIIAESMKYSSWGSFIGGLLMIIVAVICYVKAKREADAAEVFERAAFTAAVNTADTGADFANREFKDDFDSIKVPDNPFDSLIPISTDDLPSAKKETPSSDIFNMPNI